MQTSSNIIENTSESNSNSINFDILNQTNLIYDELKRQFVMMQKSNYNNRGKKKEKEKEKENNKIDIYFKCKDLSYYYIQFLFGKEIQKIIKLFNYCLD